MFFSYLFRFAFVLFCFVYFLGFFAFVPFRVVLLCLVSFGVVFLFLFSFVLF